MGMPYIPPPPAMAIGLGAFMGGEVVPKVRGKELLRRRAFGYWGHVGPTIAPTRLLHRHMFAIAGSGTYVQVFYNFGAGVVHRCWRSTCSGPASTPA